jgi:hypothetical protein
MKTLARIIRSLMNRPGKRTPRPRTPRPLCGMDEPGMTPLLPGERTRVIWDRRYGARPHWWQAVETDQALSILFAIRGTEN